MNENNDVKIAIGITYRLLILTNLYELGESELNLYTGLSIF